MVVSGMNNDDEPTRANVTELAYYFRRDSNVSEVAIGLTQTELGIVRHAFASLHESWRHRTGDVPEVLSEPTNRLLALLGARLDHASDLFEPKPQAANEEEDPVESDPDPLIVDGPPSPLEVLAEQEADAVSGAAEVEAEEEIESRT